MKKIIALLIAVFMVFTLSACGGNGNDDVSADAEKEISAEENVDEEHDEPDTVFSPKDVSDESIESINTYGDYLIMYKMIIDDYFANYESAIKDTVLYDEATFQQLKDETEKSFAEQEEQYGSIKDQKIIGKDDLVQYLKDYRDSLKEYVDALADSLEAFQ